MSFVIPSLRQVCYCERSALDSCQRPLWGLRAQKIPVIASLRSNLSFTRLPAPSNRDCHVPRDCTFCQSPCWVLRALGCILSKPPLEVASPGLYPVIASLRSNLSFIRLPALENRDRHAPLAMTDRGELAKQSLFYPFASPGKPRSRRPSRLYFLSKPPWGVASAWFVIASVARQSLLSVCQS